MRGADGVRDKLAELLAYETARKIPLLREVWSLSQDRAPDIHTVSSGELPGDLIEGGVVVVVVNPRLVRTVRVDIDNAGRPVYHTRYSCRVYVYARAKSWDKATAARDNTAVACRLALLEYPNLSVDTPGDTGYRLHENTYTEEFGEPRRDPVKAITYATAVLAIDMDCEETLADGSTRPPIGQADTTTLLEPEVVGTTQPLTDTTTED